MEAMFYLDDSNTTSSNLSLDYSFNDMDMPMNLILIHSLAFWINGAICLFGIGANILTFVTLLHDTSHSAMFYLLRGLAMADMTFLSAVFFVQIVTYIHGVTGYFEGLFLHRGYIVAYVKPFIMIGQLAVIWFTVLVSAERFVAVCYPLKATWFCTLKNTQRGIALIFLSAILYNVPRFFEHHVITFQDGNTTHHQEMENEMVNTDVYRYLYNIGLYFLTYFLLPFALLTCLNLRLILTLRKQRRIWMQMSAQQRNDHTLTVIPLCIVVVFIVGGVPDIILTTIFNAFPEIKISILFPIVSNTLILLNSSINFIIYCLLGRKFRKMLTELFTCKTAARGSNQYIKLLRMRTSRETSTLDTVTPDTSTMI